MPREPRMSRVIPRSKHSMRNDAKDAPPTGGTGSIRFINNVGSVFTLHWVNGLMQESGDFEVNYYAGGA